MRLIRLLFHNVVVGTLWSCVANFVVEAYEYDMFDRFVLEHGRKLMKGEATLKEHTEEGGIRYRRLPNGVVWKFLRMAPSRTELAILRLQDVPTGGEGSQAPRALGHLHVWARDGGW